MTTYTLLAQIQPLSMPQSEFRNNFGLSEDRYTFLAQSLKVGDESLLRHIAQNHFQACIKYLINNCKISEDQAYDICLDTMLVFRDKVLNDRISYGNLSYLYTRMAKNALIDKIKKDKKFESAVDLFLYHEKLNHEKPETKIYKVLEASISELDTDSTKLINDIYFSEKDVNKVADENNISYATLRKRKQRLLEKVRRMMEIKLSKQ